MGRLIILFLALVVSGCDAPPPGMVLIPGGSFIMGTDQIDSEGHALSLGLLKPWYADETPERELSLVDFYIDRYEVVNRDYYIFCQATDHKPPRRWGGPKYPEGRDNYPVTEVTYFDASAYAEWAGKRLPTEEEWEKAARGNWGHIYPWGNEFDPTAANLSRSNKIKKGHALKPVGNHPGGASPFGVQDMIGNVWEWVWDYYLPYPGSKFDTEDYEKKRIVVRGLSYMGVGHFPKEAYAQVVELKARASYREKLSPLARKKDVGFRCAKNRPPFLKRIFGPQKKKSNKQVV